MKLPRLRRPRRRRTVVALVVAGAIVLALAVLVVVTRPAGVHTVSRLVAGTPENDGRPVQLDTTLYLPTTAPAPAILLAHGFGGDKTDLDTQARDLARAGYVVLTYSARGFGNSGGLVHLDAPAFEVADASKLVDYLATQESVRKDSAGRPEGRGGRLVLRRRRWPCCWPGPTIGSTRWARTSPGTAWSRRCSRTGRRPDRGCSRSSGPVICSRPRTAPGLPIRAAGKFAPDICAAYQRAAQSGTPDAAMSALLRASSPASVLASITAPTLLIQGEQDSLFPLTEADANARGIAAHGTPVKVIWRSGGHDGRSQSDDVRLAFQGWFDARLRDKGSQSHAVPVRGPGRGSLGRERPDDQPDPPG